MTEVLPRRASFRRTCLVALLCLSIASCAWMHGHNLRQVGFQRMLFGQIYLIILAAAYSLPVAAENAMVMQQIAPREWALVRDATIVAMVISNFNQDPTRWAPVAMSVLSLILYRYYRGGGDRDHEPL